MRLVALNDNLLAFRHLHRNGRNFVVSSDVKRGYKRAYDGHEVSFVGLSELIEQIR